MTFPEQHAKNNSICPGCGVSGWGPSAGCADRCFDLAEDLQVVIEEDKPVDTDAKLRKERNDQLREFFS